MSETEKQDFRANLDIAERAAADGNGVRVMTDNGELDIKSSEVHEFVGELAPGESFEVIRVIYESE